MIENNGKKIAAILGVASCFPIVATAYAMETEQQRIDEPYITMDTIKDTIKDRLQEIEGLSYFIDESKTESKPVEKVTLKRTLKAVNSTSKTFQNESNALIEDVMQTIEEQTETSVVEDSMLEEEVISIEIDPVEEPQEDEIYESVVEEEVYIEEDVYVSTTETVVEQIPVAVEQPQPMENIVENTEVIPDVQSVVVPSNPYDSLNANIVASATSLVGIADGQWCMQVVQQALAGAGVQDAYQLWPDEYASMYGYYTNTPETGNLVYYYNGGRGVDHIAIYIGNGMAVHGNYGTGDEMGKTVIAPVIINGRAPQYIQVTR